MLATMFSISFISTDGSDKIGIIIGVMISVYIIIVMT